MCCGGAAKHHDCVDSPTQPLTQVVLSSFFTLNQIDQVKMPAKLLA
jgi:hypothetical protein